MQTLHSVRFRGIPVAIFPEGSHWTAITTWGWAFRGAVEGGEVTEVQVHEANGLATAAKFGDVYAVNSRTHGLRLIRASDLSVARALPEIAGAQVASGHGHLVVEAQKGAILGLDEAGNTLWTGGFRQIPYSLAVGPDTLHAAYANQGIKSWHLQPKGKKPKKAAAEWSAGGIPVSVAVGRDALWVGHAQLGKLSRVSPDGSTETGALQLERAQSLVICERDGREYLLGSGSGRAWIVDTASMEVVKSIPMPSKFHDPMGLALDEGGNLWFGFDEAVMRAPTGL